MAKKQDGQTAVADAPADFVDPALASTTPPASEVDALKARIAQLEAQAAAMGAGGKPAFIAPQQPAGCTFWKVSLLNFLFHGEHEVCVKATDPANAIAEFYKKTGINRHESIPQVVPSSEAEFDQQKARLDAALHPMGRDASIVGDASVAA